MSTRLKVGFVSVLSCLALMLALFASTGVVSAYSAQATQSQVRAGTSVTTAGDPRGPQRRYRYCSSYRYGRCYRYSYRYGYAPNTPNTRHGRGGH